MASTEYRTIFGLTKQFTHQLFTGHLEMSGNIFQNPVQSSDTEWFMQGNGDGMIFAPYHRVKTLVAPGLMHDTIPIPGEQTCKFVPVDISRQFHTAISSSFTE